MRRCQSLDKGVSKIKASVVQLAIGSWLIPRPDASPHTYATAVASTHHMQTPQHAPPLVNRPPTKNPTTADTKQTLTCQRQTPPPSLTQPQRSQTAGWAGPVGVRCSRGCARHSSPGAQCAQQPVCRCVEMGRGRRGQGSRQQKHRTEKHMSEEPESEQVAAAGQPNSQTDSASQPNPTPLSLPPPSCPGHSRQHHNNHIRPPQHHHRRHHQPLIHHHIKPPSLPPSHLHVHDATPLEFAACLSHLLQERVNAALKRRHLVERHQLLGGNARENLRHWGDGVNQPLNLLSCMFVLRGEGCFEGRRMVC